LHSARERGNADVLSPSLENETRIRKINRKGSRYTRGRPRFLKILICFIPEIGGGAAFEAETAEQNAVVYPRPANVPRSSISLGAGTRL
jgi:hypothetical protein